MFIMEDLLRMFTGELMANGELRDLLARADRLFVNRDHQGLSELGPKHISALLGDIASSGALDLPVGTIAIYWGVFYTLTRLQPINAGNVCSLRRVDFRQPVPCAVP